MEQHAVTEKPYFWEERKNEGVMEMDMIKASKAEKKD